MADVLMLLKCNGLDYDDRVRKECETLKENFDLTSEIHVLEDRNKSKFGQVFTSKTQFYSYSLLSRKVFKGNKFLLIKVLEFLFRVFPKLIKKRKIVWLHDPIMFIYVPIFKLLKSLGRIEKIVWDQHELPPEKIISNKSFLFIYKWALSNVDIRIQANIERGDFLNNCLKTNLDFIFINNFVDQTFVNEKSKDLPENVLNWLGGDSYVLLQSGAYSERNFPSVVQAFCEYKNQKCLVVGGTRENLEEYRRTYGNFDEIFYFVGMVPQMRLIDYIDRAKYSLILYKSTTVNSKYCEANRLYQASCRGTFVVVGNNPTMARYVTENLNGYILKDDGSDPKYLKEMLYYFEKNPLKSVKVVSSWEAQNCKFKQILLDK